MNLQILDYSFNACICQVYKTEARVGASVLLCFVAFIKNVPGLSYIPL